MRERTFEKPTLLQIVEPLGSGLDLPEPGLIRVTDAEGISAGDYTPQWGDFFQVDLLIDPTVEGAAEFLRAGLGDADIVVLPGVTYKDDASRELSKRLVAEREEVEDRWMEADNAYPRNGKYCSGLRFRMNELDTQNFENIEWNAARLLSEVIDEMSQADERIRQMPVFLYTCRAVKLDEYTRNGGLAIHTDNKSQRPDVRSSYPITDHTSYSPNDMLEAAAKVISGPSSIRHVIHHPTPELREQRGFQPYARPA